MSAEIISIIRCSKFSGPVFSGLRLAVATLFLGLAPCSIAQNQAPTYVPGEVLVGVNVDADNGQEAERLSAIGSVINHSTVFHDYHLRLVPGLTVEAAIDRLLQMPEVRYAEPNGYVRIGSTPPNDYLYTHPAISGYPAQYGPQHIKAEAAWGIWQPRKQIVIAIIDTGVNSSHLDLTDKILRDGLAHIIGYDSTVNPYSLTNPNPAQNDALDDNGHGSHCAGIAGAETNNTIGIAGIAGWDAPSSDPDTDHTKIMPVKALDNTGVGTFAQLADGVQWAVDHGANVLSMSFYTATDSSMLKPRIEYAWNKGCLMVACAGNESSSTAQYPAAYDNVISVAASDQSDTLAGFSTYGTWVSVAAPGGKADVKGSLTATDQIISTWMPSSPMNVSTYAYDWGTSMSCPHVAGEAALIWSQNPALNNYQVSSIITHNTSALTSYSGRTIASGSGIIDAEAALTNTGGFDWKVVALVDLNGDGVKDIVYENQTNGDLAYWLMTWTAGQLTYLSDGTLPNPGAGWHVVGSGDFNGDGKQDLIFQNDSTRDVVCWYMNGTSYVSYAYLSPSNPGSDERVVAVADFNGDGKPDILFENDGNDVTAGALYCWFMNGVSEISGTAPSVSNVGSQVWVPVATGDFNSDGKTDIIFQNRDTRDLIVWYMGGSNGMTFNSWGYLSPSNPGTTYWQVLGNVGDLNSNGTPDLLLQEQLGGTMVHWLMSGASEVSYAYTNPNNKN